MDSVEPSFINRVRPPSSVGSGTGMTSKGEGQSQAKRGFFNNPHTCNPCSKTCRDRPRPVPTKFLSIGNHSPLEGLASREESQTVRQGRKPASEPVGGRIRNGEQTHFTPHRIGLRTNRSASSSGFPLGKPDPQGGSEFPLSRRMVTCAEPRNQYFLTAPDCVQAQIWIAPQEMV